MVDNKRRSQSIVSMMDEERRSITNNAVNQSCSDALNKATGQMNVKRQTDS